MFHLSPGNFGAKCALSSNPEAHRAVISVARPRQYSEARFPSSDSFASRFMTF
ncbi:hypothetical protein HGRIS_011167 [Hohenbuehelia grisea]|uniref:Uncharacterized protein n=1 Tax=Hohenbuehelia grisea TaxID=104357 RepID=A0ABR3JW16_9AGAR